MKLTSIATLLPALVISAAVVQPQIDNNDISRRDEPETPKLNGEKPFGDTIPFRRAAKFERIAPLTGIPGAQRVRIIYGPFKARSASDKAPIAGTFPSMDPAGTAYNFHLDQDFPRDVTLLVAESNLLNSDFSRASLSRDQVYNHHNVFMQVVPKQPPMYRCENASVQAKPPPPMNLFAGAATEKFTFNFTSPEPTKLQSGFYIPRDAVMQNMLDLVNAGPRTRDFYTDTELEFIPGSPSGYAHVRHTIMNPNICGGVDGYALHPPPGQMRFTVRSAGIVMDTDGTIVRATSHTHDGGVDLTLFINDKEACKSIVNYGGPGFSYRDEKGRVIETINSTTECRNVMTVKKGDRLRIIANFDLEKHPLRAMGASTDAPSAGHSGGHGGMKNLLDDVEGAEAMALMYLYWAGANE